MVQEVNKTNKIYRWILMLINVIFCFLIVGVIMLITISSEEKFLSIFSSNVRNTQLINNKIVLLIKIAVIVILLLFLIANLILIWLLSYQKTIKFNIDFKMIKKRCFKICHWKTFDLVLIAFFVSLSLILDYLMIFFPKLPMGGSIGLKYWPVFLIAFVVSFWHGIVTGVISALVSLIIIPQGAIINPWQYLLDYFIPMIMPSLIGIVNINFKKRFNANIKISFIITVICIIIYICDVLSGVLYFDNYAWDGFSVWGYALIYNLIYVFIFVYPLMIISLPLLFRVLMPWKEKYNNQIN
ncbi:energy-coupled thiamine transporter ThiT [Spiroplasma endosymbiont of Asaphidion curtum]|uniref:energy-coupled thiamine transporter ThiT n=1 Tax=Spiroplasma endosymbiont of Asaphidion curtum TaxID=3066281 RepID=UPI00313B62BC